MLYFCIVDLGMLVVPLVVAAVYRCHLSGGQVKCVWVVREVRGNVSVFAKFI